jgi:molybdopterin converting factor small subunit
MTSFEVLLFSVLREKVGREVIEVAVQPPATGAALLDALVASYPVIGAYRPYLRLAVNQAYVDEHVALAEGDEVALITPVSGG